MPTTSMPTTVRRSGSSRRNRARRPLADLAAQAKTLLGAVDAVPAARRRDGAAAAPLPAAAARRGRGARPHAQGRAPVVRRGVARALRRGRADAARVALPEDPRPARRSDFPGDGPLRRPLRGVPPALRHPAREARRGLPGGHRGMPRAHARSTSRSRPASASRSSTSPTSRGAATTGIRATSAA